LPERVKADGNEDVCHPQGATKAKEPYGIAELSAVRLTEGLSGGKNTPINPSLSQRISNDTTQLRCKSRKLLPGIPSGDSPFCCQKGRKTTSN
jgi:hypothetical protein